jgi:hypothetical protein
MKSIDLSAACVDNDAYVRDVAVIGSGLFTIIGDTKLYKSENHGDTWAEVTLPANVYKLHRVRALINRADGGNDVVGLFGAQMVGETYTIVMWASTNGGSSWNGPYTITTDTVESEVASISDGRAVLVLTLYKVESSLVRRLFISTTGGSYRGTTWNYYDFTPDQVHTHLHCVWADRNSDAIYLSFGDAFADGGATRSGVMKSIDAAHNVWATIYQEHPGARIVPVTCNERKRFFGIESGNGGALATVDDINYEVIFGRKEFQFMDFDCLKAYPDGLLVASTYSYTWQGNGMAGQVWISDDDGHSFIQILTGHQYAGAFTRDDNYIYVGFGYSSAGYAKMGFGAPRILRIQIPDRPFSSTIKVSNICRILMSGYQTVPTVSLAPNGSTYITVLEYPNKAVIVDVDGPGSLIVEGMPYITDESIEDGRDNGVWYPMKTIQFNGAIQKIISLDKNNIFPVIRIRNNGTSIIPVKKLSIIGST